MRNIRFEVRPTSGALGAELLGIDLAQALDAEAVADIRQAFHDHGGDFLPRPTIDARTAYCLCGTYGADQQE